MIEPIIPTVLEVREREGDLLDNAIRANVSRVVNQLRTSIDPVLLEPQGTARLWELIRISISASSTTSTDRNPRAGTSGFADE